MKVAPIDPERKEYAPDIVEQIDINMKYEGYISRQLHQIEQFKKLESKVIPEDFDYNDVLSLRREARQKLIEFKPVNIGQASRISGVNPADISVLVVYMEQFYRGKGRTLNSEEE